MKKSVKMLFCKTNTLTKRSDRQTEKQMPRVMPRVTICKCAQVYMNRQTHQQTDGRTDTNLPEEMPPPQDPQGALPLPEVPQPVALPQELQEPGARESVSAR